MIVVISIVVRPSCLKFAMALLLALCGAAQAQRTTAPRALPRTAQGRPDLQGIWRAQSRAAYDLEYHAASYGIPPGRSVVDTGTIPYQPWALQKKLENYANRKAADPLGKCFLPGVPRIMYLESPFQIFQRADQVAILFEWSQMYRLIYTDGKSPLHAGIESWMGDSRGRWEGDTLVVEVKSMNDKTWFDMAGNFHSNAMHVTERYTLQDADTIQYEATIDDAKVFTKPWKITIPLLRQKQIDRLLEYQCQAEAEEASGAFERDDRTWYPKLAPGQQPPAPPAALPPGGPLPPVKTGAGLRRIPNGKPDLSGYYEAEPVGANYGLEKHAEDFLTPESKGSLIDPPDRILPYQPWAKAERIDRELPHRGYDDPTAHCFVGGVPRSIYVPSPFQIFQTPGYVVMLFERMSWRVIPLDGRAHIPDHVRLWQGDSVGRWEGDVLVVDTTNLNGKTWLNEVGDVVSHAEHVVERFIPVEREKLIYRATVSDPLVYTKPWTIEFPLNRQPEELLEVACHEDNGDLQHLKDVRDDYRAHPNKKER